MKNLFILTLAILLVHSLSAAETEAKARVKSAAKKLADKPNYSWTSTSKSEAGTQNVNMGPTHGQTEKGGYIHVEFTYNDTEVEMAFKGEKGAIKLEGDWRSAEDLEGGDQAWIARRLKIYRTPALEAEDLVSKAGGIKEGDGGVLSGDLTEAGVQEIFGRMGRRPAEAKNAKGSVKFWMKDGVLSRYEFNVQGKVTVGEEEREVNRTTNVEIKEIGSTKVTVPDEARKKLL